MNLDYQIERAGRLGSRLAWTAANSGRMAHTRSALKAHDRLHLGSGARILDGWANLDIGGQPGTLTWDLRKPLPVPAGQVRFVYSEHFIEHITEADAERLFRHARAVMAPSGVLRVSTPDLKQLATDYLAGRLVQMPHGGWHPTTLCRMVNEGMRLWGHTFVYDEAELIDLLERCGFADAKRVRRGESEFPELRDLESRPDFGDLIVEARIVST